MNNYNIYEDIAQRTNGDVYVGVVGPVRCGKSTFISSFMDKFVLPNIQEPNVQARAKDELPQSGDGKLVMTTQPKFVPSEAVSISVDDNIKMNIRMIDCVGFMVEGALSSDEEGKTRMVKTPWSNKEMTFEDASELGTKKVINEHSNIGIFLTTDGTFGNLPRSAYEDAEDLTAKELKKSGKPYVIVLNSANPEGEHCIEVANELQSKYDAPVVRLNATELSEKNVNEIFAKVLSEFSIKSIKIDMPMWLRALPYEDDLIQELTGEILQKLDNANKISEFKSDVVMFQENENFEPLVVDSIKLGTGEIRFNVVPKQNLFYKVLSKECGIDIKDDFELISNLKSLSYAKKQYDKISDALQQVEEEGYGVVYPTLEEMQLEEPKLVKQGSKSGVMIKANAPSLHIMKVDVETEINPVIGTAEQSEELVSQLSADYEQNPEKLWQTNMFGKTLQELVNDGIGNKLKSVPSDVKRKMKKTLQRVTNEGKGGVICILL